MCLTEAVPIFTMLVTFKEQFTEGYQSNQGVDIILSHIQYALIEQIIHRFHHLLSYIYG